MSGRRKRLETPIQNEIERAIGAEPDLLLLRNSVGKARFMNEKDGREYHVPYGLGEGSPDLVGLLRVEVVTGGRWETHGNAVGSDRYVEHRVSFAVWFCLEVKAAEGALEPDQIKCHEVWRRFGAFIETVRSADEARAALARARALFSRKASS